MERNVKFKNFEVNKLPISRVLYLCLFVSNLYWRPFFPFLTSFLKMQLYCNQRRQDKLMRALSELEDVECPKYPYVCFFYYHNHFPIVILQNTYSFPIHHLINEKKELLIFFLGDFTSGTRDLNRCTPSPIVCVICLTVLPLGRAQQIATYLNQKHNFYPWL